MGAHVGRAPPLLLALKADYGVGDFVFDTAFGAGHGFSVTHLPAMLLLAPNVRSPVSYLLVHDFWLLPLPFSSIPHSEDAWRSPCTITYNAKVTPNPTEVIYESCNIGQPSALAR